MKRNWLFWIVLIIGGFIGSLLCSTLVVYGQSYECPTGAYTGPYFENFTSNGEGVAGTESDIDPYCWIEVSGVREKMKASEVAGVILYEGFVAEPSVTVERIVLEYEPMGDVYNSGNDFPGFNVWWLRSQKERNTQEFFPGIAEGTSIFWSWDIDADLNWTFALYAKANGQWWRVEPNGDVQMVQVNCIEYDYHGTNLLFGFNTTGTGDFDQYGNVVCASTVGLIPFTTVAAIHDFTLMEIDFANTSEIMTAYEIRYNRGPCMDRVNTCLRHVDRQVRLTDPVQVTPSSAHIVPTWQAYKGEILFPTAIPVIHTEQGIDLTMAAFPAIELQRVWTVTEFTDVEDLQFAE